MANDGRAPAQEQGTAADLAEQIGDLLRDRPPFGAPEGERLVWLARKAGLLDAIATEAAAKPGLIDPHEARTVADGARAQVAELRALVGDPEVYLAHVDAAKSVR